MFGFQIARPEYRQLVVELLCIVNTILLRNPELRFKMQLDLDFVIAEALAMFMKVMTETKQFSFFQLLTAL